MLRSVSFKSVLLKFDFYPHTLNRFPVAIKRFLTSCTLIYVKNYHAGLNTLRILSELRELKLNNNCCGLCRAFILVREFLISLQQALNFVDRTRSLQGISVSGVSMFYKLNRNKTHKLRNKMKLLGIYKVLASLRDSILLTSSSLQKLLGDRLG